jgi:hypothetical protein
LKAKVWASAGGVIGTQKCERAIAYISSLETMANLKPHADLLRGA